MVNGWLTFSRLSFWHSLYNYDTAPVDDIFSALKDAFAEIGRRITDPLPFKDLPGRRKKSKNALRILKTLIEAAVTEREVS